MIADTMPSLTEQIDRALSEGKLRADAAENIRRILSGEESGFAARVIGELSQANEWEELNDRFYKTLAFGTGGLRGRTIGKIVTPSERGTPTALGRPEFPCVGTNAMNYFNVGRATRGLVIYIQKWRSGQRRAARNLDPRSRINRANGRFENCLHAHSRDRRRHRQADAKKDRPEFFRRSRAGPIRWPFPNGQITKPGKCRGAEPRDFA